MDFCWIALLVSLFHITGVEMNIKTVNEAPCNDSGSSPAHGWSAHIDVSLTLFDPNSLYK